MKILFAVSNENVSNRIVDSYKKRYQDTVSFKNVFYFNAIIRELQRDKSYDSIVLSEDLEPFANSNYDVIDKFIVERMQEVAVEAGRIGKDIGIIVICTDRRTKNSYVLNKLYEYGIYNALVGADRRIDNVCSLINTPRTVDEAKEYYNIQEDELGNNLDDVSEQEVQNILIHYKKLGKNEDRYTDSFNNIASQYNDKQLRIIIKCLPINVRAVLEAECPKYQELVTTQEETEEERIQKEKIQEERKIEKEENDKKLQAKIEKERREAEKRALKEQKAAEKAAARNAKNAPAQNNVPEANDIPEIPTAPRTEGMPAETVSVASQAAQTATPKYATPKINTENGSTGIDLLDNKKKEPRMTGNVIIPGNMDIRKERKIYSDDELNNLASSPREPISGNEQISTPEVASPIDMPENNVEPQNVEVPTSDNIIPETPEMELPQEEIQETSLPGIDESAQVVSEESQTQETMLPGFEEPTAAAQTTVEEQGPVLPGFEEPAATAQTTVEEQGPVLPGFEEPTAAAQTTVEEQGPVLPGFEEPTAAAQTTVEEQGPVLPGFEEPAATAQTTVEEQGPVLPGFEEPVAAAQASTEVQEPVLPGFESINENNQAEQPTEAKEEEKVIFPEFEEIDNPIVENAVQGPIIPGLESTTESAQDSSQVLPGFEQIQPATPVEENTSNIEEPPTMNNMHVPDLANAEDIMNSQIDGNIPKEFKDIEIPEQVPQNVAAEQPVETQETPTESNVNEETQENNEEIAAEEPAKRGRGRPRKYPPAPEKPKGKRGRPRKNPLPEETVEQVAESIPIVEPSNEALNVNVPQVKENTIPAVQPAAEKMIIQTPTGPIEVEKQAPVEETNNMDGFEDVKVSSTYVEKVTADNIEVPEDNIQVDENPLPEPEMVQQSEAVLPGLEPVAPENVSTEQIVPETIVTPEPQQQVTETPVNVEPQEPVLPGFEQPITNIEQPVSNVEQVAEQPVAETIPVEPVVEQPVEQNPFEQQIQQENLGTTETAQPANVPQTPQDAVASVVPVNDLFEEVQTVQLNSSNTVNANTQAEQPQMQTGQVEQPQVQNTVEQQTVQLQSTLTEPTFVQENQVQNVNPVEVTEPMSIPTEPVIEQTASTTMEATQEIPMQPVQEPNVVNPVAPEAPVNDLNTQVDNTPTIDEQLNSIPMDNIELTSSNVQANVESSIDAQFEDIAGPQISSEPVQPIQMQSTGMNQTNDMFSNLDAASMNSMDYNNGEENTDEYDNSYEDLYASTVSSKRLQADNNNPQNNEIVDNNVPPQGMGQQNYQDQNINQAPMYEQQNSFEAPQNNVDQNYGMGPQLEASPQVQAYVPNDNRMESIQALEENRAYSTGTLSQVLTKDKKIVAFVGASKSGTSFLVNNLANLFSSLGIRTAILDMTRNKNSYFIYTNNDENLRNTAYNCIENLENGIADGIKVDRNLDVYTSVPNDGKDYTNAETILSTLIQNESLVLIDCDFTTPWGYFANASEIYLVQSMDILTIQPLTGFLRELKTRGLLEQDKLRVVINKELKVKGLSSKVIIGGMSFYNDPAMSFMTELFNKDRIKACSIPFDENVYSKYLEQIVNCQITISGYPKGFMNNLKILGNMVYPLLSKQTYSSNNSGGQNYGNGYGNQGYGNNFSPEMNNTLNQMRNKY